LCGQKLACLSKEADEDLFIFAEFYDTFPWFFFCNMDEIAGQNWAFQIENTFKRRLKTYDFNAR